MATDKKIQDLYGEITNSESATIFVAPPIRFSHKQSDFLYLLYKEVFTSTLYEVKSLKTFYHFKPLLNCLSGKSSILHYHWLEIRSLFGLPKFLYKFIFILLYKWFGGNLVWTVHNKMPLDMKYRRINFFFRRWMAKNSKLLHIQCRAAIPEISRFYGVDELKFRVIDHPKFPPKLMPRAAAIEAINHRFDVHIKVQDRLFLMIGHISEYKGINEVCEVFKSEPIQKKLIIAGPVKKGQMKYYKTLRRLSKSSENIILIPQFINEESVPEFMNAPDYLVFNFRDVITSGGVHLAMSYQKPVILPETDCMKELDGENFHFFNTSRELREIIRSC
jgi:glycosyltransferase involved in cell wall biosynthesis